MKNKPPIASNAPNLLTQADIASVISFRHWALEVSAIYVGGDEPLRKHRERLLNARTLDDVLDVLHPDFRLLGTERPAEEPKGSAHLARLARKRRENQRRGMIRVLRNLRDCCEREGFKWDDLLAAM
jgi:hypothetical protein